MSKITAQWEREGYLLRSFQAGEAEKYFRDGFSRPDPEVNRLTGSAPASRERVIAYYDRVVDDPDRYDFAIIAPDGTFLGESVINEIDWDTRCANFRIALFQSRNCAKGLGTWAVEKTRDFAFGVLKLHRLELDVFSFNPRARRVYEKAGFRVEGIRKDAVLDGGAYADDILKAMLEEDWQKLKSGAEA